MGKKDKRKKRQEQRLDMALDKAMGATSRTCSKCQRRVQILPIDSWAVCPCGAMIHRLVDK